MIFAQTMPTEKKSTQTVSNEEARGSEPNASLARHDLDRLLPLKEVMELTSLSKASIYRRFPLTFPAPVKLGLSRVAWRRSDIQRWLAARAPVSKP